MRTEILLVIGCDDMELKPIGDIPDRGILAFNGRILVRLQESGEFYVYNGHWSGMYDGSDILVYRTEDITPSEPFLEVVGISTDDSVSYYLSDPIVLPELDPYEDDAIPFW